MARARQTKTIKRKRVRRKVIRKKKWFMISLSTNLITSMKMPTLMMYNKKYLTD